MIFQSVTGALGINVSQIPPAVSVELFTETYPKGRETKNLRN